jgi:hypothetical protein
MIEWVPIKEFLKKEEDEDETFLFYDKINSRVVTTSLDTINRENIWSYFTHAAKINIPVEKTLGEKFEEFFEKHNVSPLEARTSTCLELLANIAKDHYEGKE